MSAPRKQSDIARDRAVREAVAELKQSAFKNAYSEEEVDYLMEQAFQAGFDYANELWGLGP